MCWENIGLCAQHFFTILDAVINIVREDLYDHFKNSENLHFDNYEETGNGHDLDLPIISY